VQEALFNLANTYHSQGNEYQACRHWKQALAIDPGYEEAHINLGLALRATGKTEQAIFHYKQAIAANPLSREARCNLGVALASIARGEEALAQYGEALLVDPDYTVAHFNTALLLVEERCGKAWKEEASEHLMAVLRQEPKNVQALKHLGSLYKLQGRVSMAAELYQLAIDVDPGDHEGRLALGKLLLERDKDMTCECHPTTKCCSAIPHFRLAASHSEDRSVFVSLGQFEESAHRYGLALEHYARCLEIHPEDKEMHLRRGVCLRALKKNDEAVASFEAALAVDPTYAEAHLNMSFLYAARGEIGKAKEAIKVAAECDRHMDFGPLLQRPRARKKKNPFARRGGS